MTQFLLIHGAFHGAWCWRKTVAELEKRGHRAKAIDLPGQGDDHTPLANVTLDAMVHKIIAEIANLPGKVPDRVKALVYLSAFLPQDGEALFDIEGRNPKPVVPVSMTFDAERIGGTIMPDKVQEIFYHDCSDADIADAKAKLRPQALAALMTKVHITSERFGRIPRVYVECTEDRALSIAMQRDMIAKSPPVDVRSLPASHSPFLSMPDKLADALADL
jgi:pimeloyl-ACP methyl ester carboxylesterase